MRTLISLILFLAVSATALLADAEQFESDGYIINAALTSECKDETCSITASGTVSGRNDCIILSVEILAVDNNGKEINIKAATSRSAGATPLKGKTSVKGAESAWTIKSVKTSCSCG
ncbi:MAG: hypothetical protein L7F77_09725 [Candidatus Magnetominusculus sp. LBB02]|nr:hypothetical protein [Candidatus Magnetominusculus sp. LBB02]